ncbi:hypothetical protein QQS21_000492 [Conoideocrella luteorostrata]|uniref:Major facilitator superfamily (MFS) profile domain-containing protein n=1 Tax=Conoideocrella luteorostrata TaxID=1105319 RepID=A0AAJ0FYJ1_9HYPO|nr:hypothetical protein QQS21_000492 [Conoideocrella luteorostrata]
MTVPSFPAIQSQYSISIEQANWTIAIPALGLAVGPLVWSSMGDIIGRRTIFLLGTVIALASTVGAALAPTYSGYMAARFFQAFGVSPAASIGLAITNDIFFEHERGQKVGLWVLSIDLGLLFGPFFGGFITRAGHIWIQWVVAIFLGAILVAELIFLPETLYPRNLMLAQSRNIPSVAGSREKEQTPGTQPDALEGPPRTKGLPFINFKPLPGMKLPKCTDTLVCFLKTFKFAAVSISVGAYCFTWYWWILSIITLMPVVYVDYSPETQGYEPTRNSLLYGVIYISNRVEIPDFSSSASS